MGRILVIGSSNIDLIAKVRAFPKAGETIQGLSFMQAMGGKGANQAVAAHRLGGDVSFITCLGNDVHGNNAFDYYKSEGLDVSSSLILDGISTGTAIILVDDKGENCIVITPGANNMLTPDYILKMEDAIIEADMILMQMEIPYETIQIACELAHRHGRKIMLNVAPARKLDEDLLKIIDILVVNETEAETISGESIDTIGKEAVVAKLLDTGAKKAVLTLGKNGCYFNDKISKMHIPAFPVKAVDSTAAGDTFCGALAAALGKGYGWKDALTFASAASAICVTKMGAQPSIPKESEVYALLKHKIEFASK